MITAILKIIRAPVVFDELLLTPSAANVAGSCSYLRNEPYYSSGCSQQKLPKLSEAFKP